VIRSASMAWIGSIDGDRTSRHAPPVPRPARHIRRVHVRPSPGGYAPSIDVIAVREAFCEMSALKG
jgi:hypothetical protein